HSRENSLGVMTDKKKQYYVVVKGRVPGIYTTWYGETGAAEQVQNYPEPVYKGFYTQEEALKWLMGFGEETFAAVAPDLLNAARAHSNKRMRESPDKLLKAGKVLIYTDGSAVGNPGPGGYGVVMQFENHRKELSGGYRLTTNNRME